MRRMYTVVGLLLTALAAAVGYACASDAYADPVKVENRVVAAGDTLKIILRWRITSGTADSVRLAATSNPSMTPAIQPKKILPPFTVGAWRQDTLPWIPNPAIAEGATVSLTGCVTAFKVTTTASGCGVPASYTKPVVAPTVEMDSTRVVSP